MSRSLTLGLAWLVATMLPLSAAGFVPAERWSTSALGSTGQQGDPVTLTWSIVPDGTTIPTVGASSLISALDLAIGEGPGGADLTQRPWFGQIEEALGRWSALSGLTYVYEPSDDGVAHGRSPGFLGVRGDVRIGGGFIDGSSSVLAFNGLPDDGDMALDTGDAAFFSDFSDDFRALRNVVAHEAGHGFGLLHLESSTDAFLMEPTIDLAFDGPQLDDIRGVHRLYGDVFEKRNEGQGNDSATLATSLGMIDNGESAIVGADAGPNTVVSSDDIDFVSIDDDSDTDFFSFTITAPSQLDAVLRPLGSTFRQGVENGPQSTFNASAISDLSLAIFDTDGTSLIAQADLSAAGGLESLTNIELPLAGEYFARVQGTADNVQLYQLELSVNHAIAEVIADFDLDGDVDGDDFLTWQRHFPTATAATRGQGDADGDNDVDGDDFLAWQQQFGVPGGVVLLASTSVPEPTSVALMIVSAAVLGIFLGNTPRSA